MADRSSGAPAHPGSALNLELLNHIFEFEIHTQQSKKYMDTLLFPVTEDIDFVVVGRATWETIAGHYGGIPIVRYPIHNGTLTSPKTSDTLTKMILQCKSQVFLLQWQVGTYWEKTVVPTLGEYLGVGQLKEIVSSNPQYQEIRIAKPGVVGQCKNRYKYVQFEENMMVGIPKWRSNSIKMKFDL
jgi:hypothetical protein